MHKNDTDGQGGFTILQIAIVLTIIALVTSGVMMGRSLIRQAEVLQVAANFIKFRDAVKQFQDKYKYLPGDMPTATNFWGTGTCTSATSDTPGTATCNGNGDGKVGAASNLIYIVDISELIYMWQHLTNSKFLEGAYTGRYAAGTNIWKPGTNIPKGIDNAGFAFYYSGNTAAPLAYSFNDTSYGGVVIGATPKVNSGHFISFGKATVNFDGSDYLPVGGTLSGADANAVDAKIDDGKPATGKLITPTVTVGGVSTYCASGYESASTYIVNMDNKYCFLLFLTDL